MPAIEKIPATVLTGFLGAGKTSTIRHLLENAKGRRLALIINEFGDLGVDGEIVKGCGIEGCAEEDVMELANGCICCTVADDFLPTMEAILSRDELPDHIVIETSGLALPKPLIKAFNWPEVRSRVTVDGVVALVDGPAVADGLFAHDPTALEAERRADPALDHESPLEELFEEQLGSADMVLLNKADLMDAEELGRTTELVESAVRSGVRLVKSEYGCIDPEVLLGLAAAAESDLGSRPSHHDGHDHDHDHDDFESFSVSLAETDSPDELLDRLRNLIETHGILRVKGFAAVADKPMRLVVQGVGARLNSYYDRPWQDKEARGTELVIIGLHGLDQTAIRNELAA
ncbi:MAG TPA: cobalamin biosynthesis protein CobW [Rhodospirillaceae bacterium]|nr:cobalamin biosynthesis protein CobW [Rhodospirillaceae bacterium]HAA92736.1 cobalamin biosynthesis protein CobW [Rhodospirillaceae bacterium]HAT34687.1 cobalamin biosynthesis protein CobW [Rhodospirillaceae bacterium]